MYINLPTQVLSLSMHYSEENVQEVWDERGRRGRRLDIILDRLDSTPGKSHGNEEIPGMENVNPLRTSPENIEGTCVLKIMLLSTGTLYY